MINNPCALASGFEACIKPNKTEVIINGANPVFKG
jgi:hypothetical protein